MTSRHRFLAAGATATLAVGMLAAVSAPASAAAEKLTIAPNPAYASEPFEGWGTSLVWFANATGGYPEEVRADLAEKVFGEDGLNLNIARYNIGGGNATDVPSYLRPGGAVPGWWNADLDAADDEGEITSTYADRERYAAVWDGDDQGSYDFGADASQRWWIDAIKDDVTRWEAFSNSPPYFLTESGFVSGGIGDGNAEQLAEEDMAAFADYLVTVTEELEDAHGIAFDSVEPFNEPNTNYWSTRLGDDGWPTTASRQEGAHIGAERQDAMIRVLADRLAEDGTTTEAEISAMDETNPSRFVTNWNTWSDASKGEVGRLNVHTYGTGDRLVARDIAKSSDKPLWMSEVGGDWDGTGFNLTNIDNGLGIADRVIDDLRELEPEAWVLWQPVEDLYNMEKVEKLNWGSVFIDFDCNADGDSERRLADGDADPSCKVLTNAKYNTLRNFTHYIEPGDALIPSGDDQTTAAVAAEGDELTLVHANPGTTDREITIDLSGFGEIAQGATVTPIVTTESPSSDPEQNALVEGAPIAVDAATRTAAVTVPAESVSTLVVDGVSGTADDAAALSDGETTRLIGAQSGKALTADGDALVIDADEETDDQRWTVRSISGEGTNRHTFSLQAADGRYLSAADGAASLVGASADDAAVDPALQWISSTTDGARFSLLSVEAERVLDVSGQGTSDGTGVGLWTSNNGGNQLWTLEAASDAPAFAVETGSRCVAGTAYLTVRVENTGDETADVSVATPHGDKAFAGVDPGVRRSAAFSGRSASFEAGTAEVAATTASGSVSAVSAPYDAASCG